VQQQQQQAPVGVGGGAFGAPQQQQPFTASGNGAASSSSSSSGDPSGAGGGTGGRANFALDNFLKVKVIGKGSFGKVFLVREKSTGTIFAMKVLRKENIIKRNQIEHTRTER
jgi:serine/threonine protein kinase